MDDSDDTRDNLTRLLNLGRRRRPRISRRYSAMVRGLRFALPLIALAIVTVVLAWPKMNEPVTGTPATGIAPQKSGRNELIDPHFESATSDQLPYTVTAKRAVQSLNDSNIVQLEQPSAVMTLKDGQTIRVGAVNGVYRQDAKTLVLDGDVTFLHQSGYSLQSRRMNISLGDQVSWTDSAVTGSGPAGTLEAQAMNANNATGVLVLTGPARLVLTPRRKGSTP